MAVDTATGKGADYSAATVIDLDSMGFVAKIHGKMGAEMLATQVHYLGRWFNDAMVAPEQGGGYGEALTIFLRDGKDGRPPYPNVYRHRHELRTDRLTQKTYGFPMTVKTRPLVIETLDRALREKALPWLDAEALSEYHTFVHASSNPSPRAQDGCNDDRVMADAVAVELFRQRGSVDRKRRRRDGEPRKRLAERPWEGSVVA
jgi:hypothetical protein